DDQLDAAAEAGGVGRRVDGAGHGEVDRVAGLGSRNLGAQRAGAEAEVADDGQRAGQPALVEGFQLGPEARGRGPALGSAPWVEARFRSQEENHMMLLLSGRGLRGKTPPSVPARRPSAGASVAPVRACLAAEPDRPFSYFFSDAVVSRAATSVQSFCHCCRSV